MDTAAASFNMPVESPGIREQERVRRAACGFGHVMREPLILGLPHQEQAGVAGILVSSLAPCCLLSVPSDCLPGRCQAGSQAWPGRHGILQGYLIDLKQL